MHLASARANSAKAATASEETEVSQDYTITEGATNWDDPINAAFVDIDDRLSSLEAGGNTGASAYELAVANGFVGTEAEWVASLAGSDGADGADGTNGDSGPSAYDLAVENGFVGTLSEWLDSLQGAAGANDWASISNAPSIPGDGIFVLATGTDISDLADNSVVIFFTPPTETLALRNHSESTSSASAVSSGSITIPIDTQVGDLMVVCVGHVGTDTVTPPTGWSTQVNQTATGSTATMWVFTKLAQAGDAGSSQTFTFLTNTHAIAIECRVYGGVDTSTPMDVAATSQASSGTSPTAPALTTVTDGAMLVAFYLAVDGGASGPTWTAPSGYTNEYTALTTKASGANAALHGSEKTLATAGTSGSPAATITSAGLNRWVGALLAIRPSS